MTDISGKSMEEIYREEARRYKESIEKGRVYSEAEDILTGNFDKSKSLTVTMPMEEFDKIEKLALSAHTDELSVEKLQEQLNNLAEENNKLRNALEDIMTNTPIQELLDLPFGCSCHEIASEALAAIGGDDDEKQIFC